MKDNVEWDAHTLDSDELAHRRDRTAVNHKPGQVPPPPSPTWITNQPESSVWHCTKNDIIPDFSSSLAQPRTWGEDMQLGE